MRSMGRRGLHIALLGIDGIGKSTFATELHDLCASRKIPTATASWRRHIDDPVIEGDYPLDSLRNLYFETFRLFLGGAVIDGGARRLPDSYPEFADGGGADGLEGADIAGVRPSGPLAAILLEVAGNILFHREVVGELLDQGCVVIEESYGYKHVVKDLLYAARIAPNTPRTADELALTSSFVREFFGRLLRPDVPLYLAGDPSLAQRWRTVQRGGTGRFEGLPGDDGAPDDRSFLDMQAGCAAEFERFADEHAWTRVELTDAPRAENRAAAMDAVAASPLGELLRERAPA